VFDKRIMRRGRDCFFETWIIGFSDFAR